LPPDSRFRAGLSGEISLQEIAGLGSWERAVLRGPDPRIHVLVWGARRHGWPGQARPRRK